jgi:hypothetical protein
LQHTTTNEKHVVEADNLVPPANRKRERGFNAPSWASVFLFGCTVGSLLLALAISQHAANDEARVRMQADAAITESRHQNCINQQAFNALVSRTFDRLQNQEYSHLSTVRDPFFSRARIQIMGEDFKAGLAKLPPVKCP